MNIKYKLILVLALLYCFSFDAHAQNVPYKQFKVLKGDTLYFDLKANGLYPIAIVTPSYGEYLPDYVGEGNNPKTWYLGYKPTDPDFTGKDYMVLEYRGNPGSSYFDWPIKRVEIDIDVVNSILIAEKDIYFVNENSIGDTLDILSNDSSTADSIFIDKIFNVKNGSVSIDSNDYIIFIPDTNFVGTAFFNYLIKDNLGSEEVGHVIIRVDDNNLAPDTLSYYVTNVNTVSILMNEAGFAVDTNNIPSLGELNFSNDPEIIYTPFVESTGVDQFILIKNTDTTVILITIVEGRDNGSVLIDDDIYTGKNTSISFNVKDNDFKKNYYLSNYTQPEYGTLASNGQGIFTYTPDDDFNGVDEFTYTAQLSFMLFQSATVKIYVDNFTPKNVIPYSINTSKNSEVVLSYKIPIDGYSFSINSTPLEGNVTIYDGLDTVYVNCGDIIGNDLIVYTPPTDYVGGDNFEIEYCPPNDDCVLVKININVLEELSDTTCPCASYNCVWPGDADNNGKVDVQDILPIALYMGNSETERTYSTTNWLGISSLNWDENQEANGINLKHVDSDGDGDLTENDSLAILSNYNSSHNLYTDIVTEQPDYPVYIYTNQSHVDSGDVLILYIQAGDEDYPARDLNGISYTLQLNPDMVDSASLKHQFYTDSWLGNASSSLQLSKQVSDGQVEAAFSRIGFDGVTGIGDIAICELIVEDDFVGLKREFNGIEEIPLKIRLKDVVGMDGNGKNIKFPDAETTIHLRLEGNKESKEIDLIVYPNPANNKVNVYLPGYATITQYRIFNSLGLMVDSKRSNNTKKEVINISSYSNGIYFIEILTDRNEKITEKIHVLK